MNRKINVFLTRAMVTKAQIQPSIKFSYCEISANIESKDLFLIPDTQFRPPKGCYEGYEVMPLINYDYFWLIINQLRLAWNVVSACYKCYLDIGSIPMDSVQDPLADITWSGQILKADRPHTRYYSHMPTDYRHTDKHLAARRARKLKRMDRRTDRRTLPIP